MKTFDVEFDVYFEDISPSGKIHLEKVVEWMSMAREQYFKSTCPEHLKFVNNPVKMFTSCVSILIPERAQSQWADRITAKLSPANIKKISFEMHIDFLNERTNKVIAKGIQRVAFVNCNTKEFTPIPNDMKCVVEDYIKAGHNP